MSMRNTSQISDCDDKSTVADDSNSFQKLHVSLLEQQFWKEPDPTIESSKQPFNQVSKYCDSVLSQEFTNLSMAEREKTYEELHGVNDIFLETPDFVQQKLTEMNEHLTRMRQDVDAYHLARRKNSAFVDDPTFRLAFLRADGFDASAAAKRYVFFFDQKLEYFGEQLLTKRIRYDDLDATDHSILERGIFQSLPVRDMSGRVIYTSLNLTNETTFKYPRNTMKVAIYFLSRLAEDKENQKRGLVIVVMQPGRLHTRFVSAELAKRFSKLMNFIPLRTCAVHFCINDPVMDALARIVLVGSHASLRSRFRVHSGTYTEIMYKLMTYGIPIKHYPMDGMDQVDTAPALRWNELQRFKDEKLSEDGVFDGIALPSRTDVLLGKGRPLQDHPGNVQLRYLVQEFLEEYISAKKANRHTTDQAGTKVMVVKKVVNLIRASNGRFLTREAHGWWLVAPESEGHEKVMKVFAGAQTRKSKADDDRQIAQKIDLEPANFLFVRKEKKAKFAAF